VRIYFFRVYSNKTVNPERNTPLTFLFKELLALSGAGLAETGTNQYCGEITLIFK